MGRTGGSGDVLRIVSVVWDHPLLTGIVILMFTPPFFPLVVYFSPLLMSTALCVAALLKVGSQMDKIKAEREGHLDLEVERAEWAQRAERERQSDRVVVDVWTGRVEREEYSSPGVESTEWPEREAERDWVSSSREEEFNVQGGTVTEDQWTQWVREYEARPGWSSDGIVREPVKDDVLKPTCNDKLAGVSPPKKDLLQSETSAEDISPVRKGKGEALAPKAHVSDVQALESLERILSKGMRGVPTAITNVPYAVKGNISPLNTEVPAEILHRLKTAGLGCLEAGTSIRGVPSCAGVKEGLDGKGDVSSGTIVGKDVRDAEVPPVILYNVKTAGLGASKSVKESNPACIAGGRGEATISGIREVKHTTGHAADLLEEKRVVDAQFQPAHNLPQTQMNRGASRINLETWNFQRLPEVSNAFLHAIPDTGLDTSVTKGYAYEASVSEGSPQGNLDCSPQEPLPRSLEVNTSRPREAQHSNQEQENNAWGRSYSARQSPRHSRRQLEPRRVSLPNKEFLPLQKSLSLKAHNISISDEGPSLSIIAESPRKRISTLKPLVWRSRSLESRDDQ